MTNTLLLEYFGDLLVTPENAEQLNRAILQLAIEGKLTHREVGDKSAKELLAHIRTERENLGKARSIQAIDQSEYPFDIPDGWEWVRLGDLVKKIGAGSTPKGGKEVYTDSGTKFIRSQNVWNEGLYLDDVAFISDTINEKMSGTVVEAKDILLNITGASIARCALVPDDFDSGNVNQHVMIIRLVEPEIRKFIHICMTSPYIYNLIMSVQVGMSREGLSIGKLEKFVLPLPPLAEQQRIVARVEELFAQTRALAKELAHSQIELDGLNKSALSHLLASETPDEFNQHWDFIAVHFDLLFQTPEHVAPLRQSILELAVRGKLTHREAGDESAKELLKRIKEEKAKFVQEGTLKEGKPLPQIKDDEKPFELPKGWEWVKFEHVAANRPNALKAGPFGSSLKKSIYVENGYKIYGQEQVIKGDAEYGDYYIDERLFEQLRSNEVFPGDILISLVGTIGKVLVLPEGSKPGIINPRLVKLSLFEEVNRSYFKYYLYSPTAKNLMSESSHGGTMNILNLGLLRELPVPLPPLAEQERIVKRVEQLLSLCDALEARLQSAEDERGRLVAAVMAGVGG